MDCRSSSTHVVTHFMAAVVLAAGGCSLGRREYVPPQDPAALNDVAFTHYLASVPVATVGEGARAVLLLVGETEAWPTFAAQWAELRSRGAVKDAWDVSADDVLDRGTLAHMLAAVCGAPPSVNLVLAQSTGLGDRRYALRTCVYEGLLAYGAAHEAVTGGELLSALTRAEEYLSGRRPGGGAP